MISRGPGNHTPDLLSGERGGRSSYKNLPTTAIEHQDPTIDVRSTSEEVLRLVRAATYVLPPSYPGKLYKVLSLQIHLNADARFTVDI